MNVTNILSRGVISNLVRKAIKNGELADLSLGDTLCVDCAKVARVYDHRDYAKPLDVVPVCHGCNARRGRGANHIWEGYTIKIALDDQEQQRFDVAIALVRTTKKAAIREAIMAWVERIEKEKEQGR